MGYAMKLPGAGFSAVAVDQVTYIEQVPCTALALDTDSLSFETVGETKTLTATPTPADTTDAVSWASSDTSVATVENGVVTIHGIGSATITAACGEQTATATISQTSIKADGTLKITDSGKIVQPSAGVNDALLVGSSASQRSVLNKNRSITDLAVVGGENYDCELIRVPYGATTVKVATENNTRVTFNYMYRADTGSLTTYSGKQYPVKSSTNPETTFVKSDVGGTVAYGQAIAFRITETNLTDTPTYVYFE